MARISNRQIVEELKAGNRAGCAHLIQVYQNRLVSEAVNTFRIAIGEAEELVSDVLLAIVNKIRRFEFRKGENDFHIWVMTVFKNKVRDHVRHIASTGLPMESYDEMEGETNQGLSRCVVSAVMSAYQDALNRERDEDTESRVSGKLRAIAETLEQMETWERVLLRCRALDVPYEEIAGYTGKPVRQLKVYHARVKQKFIARLAKQYPELSSSTTVMVAHEA